MNTTLAKSQFLKILDGAQEMICVDLEATCDDRGSISRDQMEIIEYGSVSMLRWDDGFYRRGRQYSSLIKPVIHPTLTPFCTNLTTITQAEVDGARPYLQILEETTDHAISAYEKNNAAWMWCSWGAYDKNQMLQDAEHHGLSPLLSPDHHINLKVWFSAMGFGGNSKKGYGLGRAVEKLGLVWEGQAHRALPDALNLSNIFQYMAREVYIEKMGLDGK